MSCRHDAVQQVHGDKNDQLRKYYHVALKCWKFYRYVFWFLLEVSVICVGRPSTGPPAQPTSLCSSIPTLSGEEEVGEQESDEQVLVLCQLTSTETA